MSESEKPESADEYLTPDELLAGLDVLRDLGMGDSAVSQTAVWFLHHRYCELVKQLGGEREAEIAVVKHTNLQPSEYQKKPIIERVPYLERSLETKDNDDEKNWSRADYPGQFCKETTISRTTFYRYRTSKPPKIKTRPAGGKCIQVYLPDLKKYRK